MILVSDDIELVVARGRCRWRWLERDGPKLVGLTFASEDFELMLVDMNLMFIE